jgi:hypothetical protein
MQASEMQTNNDYLVVSSQDSLIKTGDRIRVLDKGDILEKSGKYIISVELLDAHLYGVQVEPLVPNTTDSI